jgi:hypothetical protein
MLNAVFTRVLAAGELKAVSSSHLAQKTNEQLKDK